jgi:acyl-CoA synthetase (NDP forming)
MGGLVAERRLVAEARAHGMRVIGPNALGVANTAPDVRLNATLAPELPGRGRIGFFAQSGALGIAILAAARKRGLGLSTFVSAGNRADLSGNDMLQYWQTDPATDVVLLYLETFGNPRKFARVARRLARTKPIVAVKSGRNTGTIAALADHNEPIDDASVRALFEQAGVIRVETLSELFDTALLLAHQPLPAGPRVAVVGNSTALGVLVVDALLGEGLQMAGDPVDVGVVASPEKFATAVAAALAPDGGADALVAVFVPPVATPGDAYARALRETVASVDKPVVAVFFAAEGVPAELAVPGEDGTPVRGSVPCYASPERAAAALARVARYGRWRAEPVGDFTLPTGIDSDAARAFVAGLAVGVEGRALTDEEATQLLAYYGIPLVEFRRVAGGDATVAAAEELGYPVAVKTVGERWRHRPDLIGIRLDVVTPTGARRAHEDLARLSGQDEMYVQHMAPKGVSCVLEIIEDPSFGSLISFGLAGTATELLGDRAFRVVPVSDHDAAALVRAPRAAPLLDGYRGAEPTDLAAMQDLVRRIGALAEDLPEVRGLALDPVLATSAGVSVIGARAIVGLPPQRDDTGPRRLR